MRPPDNWTTYSLLTQRVSVRRSLRGLQRTLQLLKELRHLALSLLRMPHNQQMAVRDDGKIAALVPFAHRREALPDDFRQLLSRALAHERPEVVDARLAAGGGRFPRGDQQHFVVD